MECCASFSRCCGVDSVLKALGADSKRDYADKIPNLLSPDNFDLHNTFHHGFPSNPTCLAYDPLQKLLAIGTETGEVLLLGKPGLERYFSHPLEVSILQMIVITNKGLLVTSCDNKTLYLWSLQTKSPCILHKMEFRIERPTAISWKHDSQWMYVGTGDNNVYVVHVERFSLSGYWIAWKDATAVDLPGKPGLVMAVEEHPKDHGKVLIAYSRGLCVLWDLEKECADDRFYHKPRGNHTLTDMCWLGNGKVFACSYSDGSILLWNPNKSSKPMENFFLHDSDGYANRRIHKLQLVRTDSDPWFFCSGGFPEETPSATCTLTICHVLKSSSILSTSSPILDFLCLPSSPFSNEHQKPFALVVLTKNELTFHDLQSSGYPRFNLPYALDVHLPPVTCMQYCGNCPEELIASFHSINSKLMAKNKTKPWPLMGGKWGEEAPQISTDLIITGHTDGSVRLWFCNSVVFQPLFTMSTPHYFTLRRTASALQSQELHMTADTTFLYRSSPKVQVVPLITKLTALCAKWRMAITRVISSQQRRPTDITSASIPTEEFVSSKEFAIQEIHLSQHGPWMCVANTGGSVLVFHFRMEEATTTTKSLDIYFGHDSVLKLEDMPTTLSSATKPSWNWVLQKGSQDSLPGFYLAHHCQCYCPSSGGNVPATVSSMQYSRDMGMLAIGTDQGFALVDTVTNRCLHVLSNLTSILYMAAPSKYSELKRKFDVTSRKRTVKRKPTLRSMSRQMFGQGFVPPGLNETAFLEEVVECECSVTALEVVRLQLDKQAPPTLTLWVGLASGHVAAYGINIRQPGTIRHGLSQRIILTPTYLVAEQKSSIVSLHFLNEWGDLQVVPYKPHVLSREEGQRRYSESYQSEKPLHYAIVTDENRVQSFSFPGFVPVSKCIPSIKRNVILSSAYFTCKDLPCLLTLTSCQLVLVHSLPRLKPLMQLSFPLLRDCRVLCTFRVSGSGQAMYMFASKIQRISVVKNDRLNLPACLPDMFVHRQPLVNGTPTKVDRAREEMFGEAAGRPRIGVLVFQRTSSATFTQSPADLSSSRSLHRKLTAREGRLESLVTVSEDLAAQAELFSTLVSTTNTDQEQRLLVAARDGKVNILQRLLQKEGVNASVQDSDGNTPLHLASMNGRFDAVKLLVQKLVERSLLSSLRAKNRDENDASFLAHKLGHKDIACYITHEYYKHQYPRISFQSFIMETVDSSGTMISSLEYGITIIIPPGAIPEGTEIQVQVQCCFGGPFVLPKDYSLCSPVYIISPSFQFLKDIELWMVHHAYLSDPEDCSQITFLTDAPSLETSDLGQPEYHLSPIQGGRFSVHGVVGRISLRHFCKKAIAAKISTDGATPRQRKIEDRYILQLYTPVSPFQQLQYAHVLFTVGLFIPPYCKGSLKHYLERTFPEKFWVSAKQVVLTMDTIKLLLPRRHAEEQGYNILPDIDPCEVLKEAVDLPKQWNTVDGAPSDDSGSLEALEDFYPPRILLTITPRDDTPQRALNCQLEIEGTTQSRCAFRLNLRPTTGQTQLAPVMTESPGWQTRGRKITLKELANEVVPGVCSKWQLIGIQLDLSHRLLRQIEADHPRNTQKCCIEMFSEWLSQDIAASWPTLKAALTSRSVSERQIAESLNTHFS